MHVEVGHLDEMSRMEAGPRCEPDGGWTGATLHIAEATPNSSCK